MEKENLHHKVFNNIVKPVLIVLAAVGVARMHTGCTPATNPQLEKQYNDQLLACVNDAKNRVESCECRLQVDEAWGLCDHPEWPQIGRCDYRCDQVPENVDAGSDQ